MVEVIERRARIGIELIDALIGGPVMAASRVRVENGAEALRATSSRWFVEDALPATTIVTIEADGYVPEEISVAVPPPGDPGVLVEVRLKPRTGYAFPSSLTRVVGPVVFDATGEPASGVDITVTPVHGADAGAVTVTRTTEDGQFTMWFLPAPAASGLTPPVADGYRVDALIVVDGVLFAGSLPLQPLLPNRRTDAPVLRLTA